MEETKDGLKGRRSILDASDEARQRTDARVGGGFKEGHVLAPRAGIKATSARGVLPLPPRGTPPGRITRKKTVDPSSHRGVSYD